MDTAHTVVALSWIGPCVAALLCIAACTTTGHRDRRRLAAREAWLRQATSRR